MTCRQKTTSGAVCEIEIYTVPENTRSIRNSEPKPENVRTPEEKERYNRHKSEKHFVRLVNANFTSGGYYVTLTYDNEHLPESYSEALKCIDNYTRRLKYSNPNARIISVTGYGVSSGRLHHHLIIENVSEADILNKWSCGTVSKAEQLRKHNYYNGTDHGEDFTALAVYLHKHAPAEYKGKRWKQTKSILQPVTEKKEVKRAYSPNRPPKAPKGYVFIEAKTSEYYKSSYIYFKYVRQVTNPLNIQPIFSNHRAGTSARL